MLRVLPDRDWPLFDVAATRRIEQAAAAGLPPHTLMQRAGLATARLALAIAPHARRIWVACGPGNNGGDGFEAAMQLSRWGKAVTVTLAGAPEKLPADAAASLARCLDAGLAIADGAPAEWDLAIDALLGIGTTRPLAGAIAEAANRIDAGSGLKLAVDVPSGLSADTGQGDSIRATHTLSLLTCKPGLFTGRGRDAAGQCWFDDLGVPCGDPPTALLAGAPAAAPRLHASHKGTYGDVAVIGGAAGMTGAAVLAASAALHAGAGRVYFCPLDASAPALVAGAPELMVRDWRRLSLQDLAVACGCGGGEAVAEVLAEVLAHSRGLVLDADALNAIARDVSLQSALRARSQRRLATIVTPHPLEAARLLGGATPEVQANRLRAATSLADAFGCVAVLKGSGTVVAAPGRTPAVNPTGNARLATGGTGDVLAGYAAALLASGMEPFEAAVTAVYRHGDAADRWPAGLALTAGELARWLAP